MIGILNTGVLTFQADIIKWNNYLIIIPFDKSATLNVMFHVTQLADH